jgi:protein gp37
MADGTKIEWTDATVNAVNGCSVVSPGCTNCYAMRLAGTRMKHHPSRAGLTQESKAGPVWTGEVRLNEAALLQPLRWRRPRRIFWNAHGDLFHPNVPDEWIDRVFAVCALTSSVAGANGQPTGGHQHQILTKRPERMRDYFADPRSNERMVEQAYRIGLMPGIGAPRDRWPLPNVWLGVSAEDQARADERIPHLLATPAAVRFLSCEPLLGSVDLHDAMMRQVNGFAPRIDWVIVGGESGPGARPMDPDWARQLRDQCEAAGVPFFFKQWGEWLLKLEAEKIIDRTALNLRDHERTFLDEGTSGPFIRVGKRAAGRLLDGVQHDGMPA